MSSCLLYQTIAYPRTIVTIVYTLRLLDATICQWLSAQQLNTNFIYTKFMTKEHSRCLME